MQPSYFAFDSSALWELWRYIQVWAVRISLVLGIMSVFPGLVMVAYDCGLYVWRFVAAAVVSTPVAEAAGVVMVEGAGELIELGEEGMGERGKMAEVRQRHGIGKSGADLAGKDGGDIDPI